MPDTDASSLPRPLPGGLILRRAEPGDADGIVELSLAQHGDQEAWGLVHTIDQEGIDAWTVVADGDRIVSTSVLLAQRLCYGEVALPVGRIEYVATDDAYRRRGLVRLQFEAHQAASEARGDVLQLVTGIPYFYRRLGYAYGLSYPARYRVPERDVAPPPGYEVDVATAEDLEWIMTTHARGQASAAVRLAWSRSDWEALVALPPVHPPVLFVARRAAEARGWMRLQPYPEDGMAELLQASTADRDAAAALVTAAMARCDGLELGILDQPDDPLGVLVRSVGHAPPEFGGVFVRVPDAVALLDAVRPELSRRLAASALAGERGSLTVSLYERSIVLDYADGEVTAVSEAAGIEDPPVTGDVGVPPDAVAALVLGRFGAVGLADRVDDVVLGRHTGIMELLFPRLRADVIDLL